MPQIPSKALPDRITFRSLIIALRFCCSKSLWAVHLKFIFVPGTWMPKSGSWYILDQLTSLKGDYGLLLVTIGQGKGQVRCDKLARCSLFFADPKLFASYRVEVSETSIADRGLACGPAIGSFLEGPGDAVYCLELDMYFSNSYASTGVFILTGLSGVKSWASCCY